MLSDDTKRAQYDRFGHAGIDSRYSQEDIFRNINFDDIFGDLGFGGGFGGIFDFFFGGMGSGMGRGAKKGGPKRGVDLQYRLSISLEQAAKGFEAKFDVKRNVACSTCRGSGAKEGTSPKSCPTCKGSGQVRSSRSTPFGAFTTVSACSNCRGEGEVIDVPCEKCRGQGAVLKEERISLKVPVGVDTGTQLRVSGKGEAGVKGGPPGDLYVLINVKPHSVFERHGGDIFMEKLISYPTAVLGGEVRVATLNGRVDLKIPAGTQPGTVFRLKGKGIKELHSRSVGDQHVRVNIGVPEKLSQEEKLLIERLAEIEEGGKGRQGIFDKIRGPR